MSQQVGYVIIVFNLHFERVWQLFCLLLAGLCDNSFCFQGLRNLIPVGFGKSRRLGPVRSRLFRGNRHSVFADILHGDMIGCRTSSEK